VAVFYWTDVMKATRNSFTTRQQISKQAHMLRALDGKGWNAIRPKIYLAGKIGVGDWRHEYVDGLHDAEFGSDPIECAIRGKYDYTGPFFKDGAHGEFHGDGLHGAGEYVSRSSHASDRQPHADVFINAISGIEKASIVIAVVEDDAHGTLCEIGFAAGIGKKVIVVGASGKQCWFSKGFSVGGMRCDWFQTVDDALDWCDNQTAIDSALKKCESVPEAVLFSMLLEYLPTQSLPVPQHEVGPYRLDFAFVESKVAIEVDGIEFHGNQDAFIADRKRTRFLESHGWRVIRFAAKEILDAETGSKCVEEIISESTKVAKL
jgi:very-short-patch-repair endonuclease